jgi:hypothetical protein
MDDDMWCRVVCVVQGHYGGWHGADSVHERRVHRHGAGQSCPHGIVLTRHVHASRHLGVVRQRRDWWRGAVQSRTDCRSPTLSRTCRLTSSRPSVPSAPSDDSDQRYTQPPSVPDWHGGGRTLDFYQETIFFFVFLDTLAFACTITTTTSVLWVKDLFDGTVDNVCVCVCVCVCVRRCAISLPSATAARLEPGVSPSSTRHAQCSVEEMPRWLAVSLCPFVSDCAIDNTVLQLMLLL